MIKYIYYRTKNIYLEICAYIGVISSHIKTVQKTIPYISQFASPERVETFFAQGKDSSTDPLRQNTGADSVTQYAHWSWSICGMACLTMILASRGIHRGTIELTKKALKLGVFDKQGEKLSGMKYIPFLSYIKKLGLTGIVYQYCSIYMLAYLHAGKGYCMVSVHPRIRHANETTEHIVPERIGHLVLITGVSIKDSKIQNISIHNPSGFSSNMSQSHHTIPLSVFLKYWSKRIVHIV